MLTADTPLQSQESEPTDQRRVDVAVGRLVALQSDGQPLVTVSATSPSVVPARTTVELHAAHLGREVVLVFEDNDVRRPIIMGTIRSPNEEAWEARDTPIEIDLDGDRLVVSAATQLVLKCGKASITLTAAGKVVVSGTYIASRSSGVHRIKGGSVQIN